MGRGPEYVPSLARLPPREQTCPGLSDNHAVMVTMAPLAVAVRPLPDGGEEEVEEVKQK